MKDLTMNLRCFSFAALTLLALSRANVCAGSPAFTKEAHGDWYVLAAHQNNKNIAADKGTGSKVTITADRIVWHNPEKADVPLLDATCQRAKLVDTPKAKADPNELTSTVRGSLCPIQDATLAARWKITPDNDVLFVLVQVAAFKGNRNGTYSGAAPADVLFICQRKPVPAAPKPDPDGDANRLVGKWAVSANSTTPTLHAPARRDTWKSRGKSFSSGSRSTRRQSQARKEPGSCCRRKARVAALTSTSSTASS